MDIIALVAALLNLLALGGFFWYVRGWFKALQNTVGAQKETIATYKQLLDSADVPKMVERMDSYKKFVDREKEILQKDYERKIAEQKKSVKTGIEVIIFQTAKHFEIIASLMPYVPPERRRPTIDSTSAPDRLKALLYDLAVRAPYLPPNSPGLIDALMVALKPVSPPSGKSNP